MHNEQREYESRNVSVPADQELSRNISKMFRFMNIYAILSSGNFKLYSMSSEELLKLETINNRKFLRQTNNESQNSETIAINLRDVHLSLILLLGGRSVENDKKKIILRCLAAWRNIFSASMKKSSNTYLLGVCLHLTISSSRQISATRAVIGCIHKGSTGIWLRRIRNEIFIVIKTLSSAAEKKKRKHSHS